MVADDASAGVALARGAGGIVVFFYFDLVVLGVLCGRVHGVLRDFVVGSGGGTEYIVGAHEEACQIVNCTSEVGFGRWTGHGNLHVTGRELAAVGRLAAGFRALVARLG
jgi:hypothetical protein